jgi:hypothetical protein
MPKVSLARRRLLVAKACIKPANELQQKIER